MFPDLKVSINTQDTTPVQIFCWFTMMWTQCGVVVGVEEVSSYRDIRKNTFKFWFDLITVTQSLKTCSMQIIQVT